MGLFAADFIKQGDFIKQLQGENCLERDLPTLSLARKTRVDDALQIEEDQYLVLSYESKILNHSCDPNACFRNCSDVFALRDIEPGEEITADYSTTVGINDDWSMQCNCSSPICRRQLGNFLSIPESTLERYIRLDALPAFIRRRVLEADSFIELATKVTINR